MAARLRFPLLVLAIASLVAAVWAGLLRLGWSLPQGRPNLAELHGPLMVFGFLGTVVSLERAVALRRAWGYLAPAGTLAGAALLLAGLRQGTGELVLLAAGCVLVALFVLILRTQTTAPAATLLLGAVAWVVGDALWLHGDPLVQVVPWWSAFLVLTIVGARLELAAMSRLTRSGRLLFLALTLLFLAGLACTASDEETGIRLAGAALAGYALWLARFAVARQTVRRAGLPGYVGLGVGGLLWLRDGAALAGFVHDAELHAIFLGFVFSMIFGHAPVIFPGVLGVSIPYRRPFYLHLGLLHAGLALRVGGDLAGSATAARWGGLVNATAIALFLVSTLASAALARRSRRARVRVVRRGHPAGVRR